MIGKLEAALLDAVLETLPVEFSVLNSEDEVAGWNKHETRIFKRPEAALGRNVRKCHPEKSVALVERILEEMKAGTRDRARFWIDLPLGTAGEPQKVLIEYHALRDSDGAYIGCLEASQNVSEIQSLTGQRRLMDEAAG